MMKSFLKLLAIVLLAVSMVFSLPMTAHAAPLILSAANETVFLNVFEQAKDNPGGGIITLTGNIQLSTDEVLDLSTSASNPIRIIADGHHIEVIYGKTVTIGDNVTIEKNSGDREMLYVAVGGRLIIDGAVITNNGSTPAIHAYGILDVYGGSIASTVMGIAVNDGGTLNISGGEIISNHPYQSAVSGASGSNCSITGGVIKSTGNFGAAIFSYGEVTVGGTAEIEGVNTALSLNGSSDGNAVITGGTISSTGMGASAVFVNNGASLTINNGEINANGIGLSIDGNNSSALINNGMITGNSGISVTSGGSLIMTDGMITATGNFDSGVSINGTNSSVNISGGIISAIREGLTIFEDTSAQISGGSITGETGIYVAGAVTISGGMITGTSDDGASVPQGGRLSMTNGSIEGKNNGINAYDSSIEIENGVIEGENRGIYAGETEIIIRGGEISGIMPGSTGVELYFSGNTLQLYAGIVRGDLYGLQFSSGDYILYNGTVTATGGSSNHSISTYGTPPINLTHYSAVNYSGTQLTDLGNYKYLQSFRVSPITVELELGGSKAVAFAVEGQRLNGDDITLQDILGASGTLSNASYTVSGNTVTFTPSVIGKATLVITDNITFNGIWDIDVEVAAVAGSLTITTPSLPSGQVGQSYHQALTVTGGTAPYRWNATGLPSGLSISSSGIISGTPSGVGTSTVTASVYDDTDHSTSKAFNLTVNQAPSSGGGGGGGGASPLSIDKRNPPEGTVGSTYSHSFKATGGRQPYSYKVSAGSLPEGLKLDENGILRGIPTAEGSYKYTIIVTDSNNRTTSYSFTQVIKDSPKDDEEAPTLEIILTIDRIEATVDSKPYLLDAAPYIQAVSNRTLVPLRFISEALGSEVQWNPETKQITITEGDREIVLTIGSRIVFVDGEIIAIDCEPAIMPPGRTFVPLRFISETLGAEVNYDNITRVITIIKAKIE
ncbi:Putative Ig domain-containing protein [Natronincola peptidivorans]|uniref:Putative Ig domain-containing protein n=1 Tax=Natronincola peptidivorans TaxID=426128 RepID=A0A1I0H5F7_9FIRM|nr:stalk domain-containing protein [Natronincola peptidivorans]SET78974.1 Putative Ig domain-containing protein [Natronincola peptidivorans]